MPSRIKRTGSSRLVDLKPEVPGSPPLVSIDSVEASSSTSGRRRSARVQTLDLSSYAYTPDVPVTPRKRAKIEPVDLEDAVQTPSSTRPNMPPTPRSSSKKMPQLALDKPHKEPDRWREQYRLIEHMRKGIVAPVDDMGCERPRTTTDADPKTLRFHILISLMLSSQTKDPVTSAAVTNLHTTLPGGLTAQSLADASVEMVHECINKVGFWRRKTEYIQEAARHLRDKEDGDVPRSLEGLCELKGVGPKMAFLCLQCAWDINAGIGVDVHVHRITNRLRWHKPQTTQAEQTRLNLQSWLPSELHKSINPMLVGFGQVICLPVGPRCDVCLLAKANLCPSRVANVKAEGRKEVIYTFTDDLETKPGSSEGVKVEYEQLVKAEPVGSPIRSLDDSTVPSGGVKTELLEPGLDEDGVLDILDQVDGSKEIGVPA